MIQDRQAVAHFRQLRQDMGGDQDGLAHFPQRPQDPFHLRPRPRIHAGGGLVQDQQLRIVNQAARQAKPLLHAPGQRVDIFVFPVLQLHQFQQLGSHPFPVGRADPIAAGVEVQVFPAGQVVVHAEEIRHVAHQSPGLLPFLRHVRAVDIGGAGGGRHQGGQNAHGGRFARAVGADKAVERAGGDFQRKSLQGGELSVVLGQVVNLQHLSNFPEGFPIALRTSFGQHQK